MKKLLVAITSTLLFFAFIIEVKGQTVAYPLDGGTGIGSATAGDVGKCIKVLDDSPFTYELGTCGTGAGGGSGTVLYVQNGGATLNTGTTTLNFTSNSFSLSEDPADTFGIRVSTTTLGLLTTNVAEGSNLYYTDARVSQYMSASSTYANLLSFYTTPSTRITAGTGIDWSGNTLNGVYTAGDALTLNGEDFDFDGGATPAGALGGTWASPTVDDDGHNHTGTTLSGIDISSDTNLSADGTEIVLTGDALSLGTSLTFTNATTTNIAATGIASTSLLSVSNTFNLFGGSVTTNNALCVQLTGSAALCDGSDATGGAGSDPNWSWSAPDTFVSPATTTNGIIVRASSTIDALTTRLSTSTHATTTNLGISGLLSFGGVVGSAWSTFCTAITGGAGLCDGADADTTYTAGDALTLTGNDIDFDGGATPSGDLGGTWASPSVTDDSHAHTGASLSGIDVSDDTNLSADGTEIVLTGDALSLGTSLTFTHATTTNMAATGLATSSQLSVSNSINLFGGGEKTTANALCLQITGDAGLCDGNDASGAGGTQDWVRNATLDGLTPTTTSLGLVIFGSSTFSGISATNSTTTNATTTNLRTTQLGVGSDYLTDITGANLSISGGALNADTGFVTVCATGCDYATIQSALDANEVDIRLKNETYSGNIVIRNADVKIVGAGTDSVISCNGVTQSPCVSATSTSKTVLRDFKILENNTRIQGIGLDIGDNPNSTYQSLRIEGFATGTRMWDQNNTSFYSSLRDITWFDNASGIEFIGTQSNHNSLSNTRCRQRANYGGTCYYLSDVRGLGLYDINAEPATQGTTTGIYIDASSRDNNFYNPWVENNSVGVSIASGATRNAFFGGSFTSNGTDYTDLGTDSQFHNINDTGTLLNLFADATTTTFGTTQLNATNASSSALTVGNSFNLFGGSASTNNALCIQLTGSTDLCDGADAGGGAGDGVSNWSYDGTRLVPSSSPAIGILALASSTLGDGSATGGLTVRGTATTTNLKVTSLTASRGVFTDANGLFTTTGTVGNLESSVGSQNILLETEIDASSELLALMDDETGTGLLTFATNPLFTGLRSSASSTIDELNVRIGTTTNATSTNLAVTTQFNFLGDIITNVATWFDTKIEALSNVVLAAASVWDYGGVGSLEIPNATGNTIDAAGEIALDTTDDQLILADGAGTARVFATDEFRVISVTMASTSLQFDSGDTLAALGFKDGLEITQFRCYVVGGTSKVVNLTDGTNDTETITCGTTMTSDTDVATNDTFTADELGYLEMGATTGTVNYLHFEAWGRIVRE